MQKVAYPDGNSARNMIDMEVLCVEGLTLPNDNCKQQRGWAALTLAVRVFVIDLF